MTVKIGIGLFTAQVPPGSGRSFTEEYRELIDLVRLAESLHFDSAWVSEHHGSLDGYMPSLLPTLAAMAAATEHIELGTGVMLTPFHDPLRLAEDAATVDLISGGRLILGLGLGWREEEFRMFGVPVAERVRRTAETVEILRKSWTGRRFSHEGRIFGFDRVRVTPAPERAGGIPIYLGGFHPDAVKRSGRLADGYIRSRGGSVEDIRGSIRLMEDGAREAGRDPSALGFAQLQNVFVWDEGDAWDVLKPFLVHQLGVYRAWAAGADTPGKDLEYAPPDDDRMRRTTPAGTPKEVAHTLRPLVEALASRAEFHLVVRLHYPGMGFDMASRAVELFAEQAIPALKGD